MGVFERISPFFSKTGKEKNAIKTKILETSTIISNILYFCMMDI